MEQLKVKKKDTIILNVVIYLCLAFFFLYLQHAYRHHLSPFSFVYLKKGLELFWYVPLALLLSGTLIWRLHPRAIMAYQASVLIVGFKVLEGLFVEFNKIIVIALFFYTVISYFLYQLLKAYTNQASLNANYASSDLFEPLLTKIQCRIVSGELELEGHLTNWDDAGCFVKLNTETEVLDQVTLKVSFRDREFVQNGEVVAATRDFSGVGIKFESTKKDMSVFNWAEFTEIVHELGYQPERLR